MKLTRQNSTFCCFDHSVSSRFILIITLLGFLFSCATNDPSKSEINTQAARTQKGEVETIPKPSTIIPPTVEEPGIHEISSTCHHETDNHNILGSMLVNAVIDSATSCKSTHKINFSLYCNDTDQVFGERKIPIRGKTLETKIELESNQVKRQLPQSMTSNQNGIASLLIDSNYSESILWILVKTPAGEFKIRPDQNFEINLGTCLDHARKEPK